MSDLILQHSQNYSFQAILHQKMSWLKGFKFAVSLPTPLHLLEVWFSDAHPYMLEEFCLFPAFLLLPLYVVFICIN